MTEGEAIDDFSLEPHTCIYHLWSRNDEVVADAIAGDININLANTSQVEFYGNQHVEK